MKKRVLLLILAIATSMGMIACGNNTPSANEPVENVKQEENQNEDNKSEENKEDAKDNKSEEDDGVYEGTAMGNPFTESDAEDMLNRLGFSIAIPEGAENVVYSVMDKNGLGQIAFDLNGVSFTVRMQETDELTDISGMNYDWGYEEDAEVLNCQGRYYSYRGDDGHVHMCIWYDAAPGIMYSLSAQANDLDGFDISVIAGQVYIPMQGED